MKYYNIVEKDEWCELHVDVISGNISMRSKIKSMPLVLSFLYFGVPTLFFWLLTKYLTPYLNITAGIHPAMSWFITGLLIFIPLFLAAYAFVKKRGKRSVIQNPIREIEV